MRELFNREYLINYLLIPVIAIGSFYDKRLVIGDFNLSFMFSLAFFIAILFKIRKVNPQLINSRRKVTLFFFLVFVINFILWLLWDINEYEDYSLGKIYSIFFIIFPIVIYTTTFDKVETILFIKQMSIVSIFLFLLGIIEVAKNGFGESRLAVFGGGPIVFSRWLGLLFLVVLYGLKIKKKYKVLILIPLIFLMFFSGSKGPLYFLFLTIALLSMKTKKSFILLLSAVFLFWINFELILDLFADNVIFQRIFGLGSGSSNLLTGSSSSARVQLLKDSFNGIMNNPFGYGLGNFPIYGDVSKILDLNGYPHNFFMEVFFELGFLIFLILLYVFYRLFRVSMKLIYSKSYKENTNSIFIISVWFFYVFNSMVSGDLSDSRFLVLFTILFINYNKMLKIN